jgi:hypothetical protein
MERRLARGECFKFTKEHSVRKSASAIQTLFIENQYSLLLNEVLIIITWEYVLPLNRNVKHSTDFQSHDKLVAELPDRISLTPWIICQWDRITTLLELQDTVKKLHALKVNPAFSVIYRIWQKTLPPIKYNWCSSKQADMQLLPLFKMQKWNCQCV